MYERPEPRAIKAEQGGSNPALFLCYKALLEANSLDAQKVLHIGAGRGSVLRYLAESRQARYSGLSTRQDFVAQVSEQAYKTNIHSMLRMYRGDLTDPRSYRSFPDCDIVLAYDVPAPLPAVLEVAASVLRQGGRLLVAGFFSLDDSTRSLTRNFPTEQTILEAAESAGLISVSREVLTDGVKVPVSAAVSALFANPESGQVKLEVLEAWGRARKKLDYLLLSFSKA